MECHHCKKHVSDGIVKGSFVYHRNCLEKIAEDQRVEYFKSQGLPYRCSACSGIGYTEEKYCTYPRDLPDFGWVEWENNPKYYDYKKVNCKYCNGKGFTAKQLKPVTRVIGYE